MVAKVKGVIMVAAGIGLGVEKRIVVKNVAAVETGVVVEKGVRRVAIGVR